MHIKFKVITTDEKIYCCYPSEGEGHQIYVNQSEVGEYYHTISHISQAAYWKSQY